jgi:hypothetical protein
MQPDCHAVIGALTTARLSAMVAGRLITSVEALGDGQVIIGYAVVLHVRPVFVVGGYGGVGGVSSPAAANWLNFP